MLNVSRETMKNFLHQLAIELRAEVLTSLSANQRLAFALTCLDMHELAGVFTKNDVSNNLKSVFGGMSLTIDYVGCS